MIENIQNSQSSAADALSLGGRFRHWEGQSGARYIFSVYKSGACPPLPGAVYVIVKRGYDDQCYPLAVGRFPAIWESASSKASKLLAITGGDEVHVHLLAEDDVAAEEVVRDLKPALGPAVRLRFPERRDPPAQTNGFSEHQSDLFHSEEFSAAA